MATAVTLGEPGAWTETFEVEVTRARIAAYARATNESDERFLAGEVAPPMFATVPVRPAMMAAFAQAMPHGLPPGVPRLAGEQDMRFHRPITAGARLLARGRFTGISPRRSGTTLSYVIETYADGALVNQQFMVTFLPGVAWPAEVGERAPDHTPPPAALAGPPLARLEQRIDPDQTFRYARASGDPSRWHLDDAAARAAGLPGIIVHGLCTMAFVGRALCARLADGDASRLRRLAVRFARPLLPGQSISTSAWSGERAGRYRFTTAGPGGTPVLTNGLAEIVP